MKKMLMILLKVSAVFVSVLAVFKIIKMKRNDNYEQIYCDWMQFNWLLLFWICECIELYIWKFRIRLSF